MFIEKNKKYLIDYFEEKLKSPMRNVPIKSGFFNQMADYIDYDKHCCRTYFHNHKEYIFVNKLKRSRAEYARFFSYIQKKKKKINKKKKSNLNKHVQKIKRRFNKKLHTEIYSSPQNCDPGGGAGPPEKEVRQELFTKEKKIELGEGNRGGDQMSKVVHLGSEWEAKPSWKSSKQFQNIFVSSRNESDTKGEGNVEDLLDRRSAKRSEPRSGQSGERPFGLAVASKDFHFQCKSRQNESMNLNSSKWDHKSVKIYSRSTQKKNSDFDFSLSGKSKLGNLESVSQKGDSQNPLNLCCEKKSEKETIFFQKDRCKAEKDCVCPNCLTEEEYLIRKMTFNSYMERIKITPQIFESLRNIRFCLNCTQPVLKHLKKEDYLLGQLARKEDSGEVERETLQSQREEGEKDIFCSEYSEKIVSESESREELKVELEDFSKRGTADPNGILEKTVEQFPLKFPKCAEDDSFWDTMQTEKQKVERRKGVGEEEGEGAKTVKLADYFRKEK